jgi:hypothetical protein
MAVIAVQVILVFGVMGAPLLEGFSSHVGQ